MENYEWIYAQLNNDSICVGVSHLAGEVNADHMILISGLDNPNSCMGMLYDEGQWLPNPNPPPPLEPDISSPDELYEAVNILLGGRDDDLD